MGVGGEMSPGLEWLSLTFREKRDVPLKEKGGRKEDVAGLLHLSQAQRERGGMLPTSVPQAYPLPHPH